MQKEKQTGGELENVPDTGMWLAETFLNNLTCNAEIGNGASCMPMLNRSSLINDQETDPVLRDLRQKAVSELEAEGVSD